MWLLLLAADVGPARGCPPSCLQPQILILSHLPPNAGVHGHALGWYPAEYPPEQVCRALAAFARQHRRLPHCKEIFYHDYHLLPIGTWLRSARRGEKRGRPHLQPKAAIDAAAGQDLAAGLL